MYELSVGRRLRVKVRHRKPAPNRYSWEIVSEESVMPVEESTEQFRSWEDASQFGSIALQKLSAKLTARRGPDF